jgi:DNA-binding CsgD family transcriptional regulator
VGGRIAEAGRVAESGRVGEAGRVVEAGRARASEPTPMVGASAGVDEQPGAGLSDAERRVAALAAQGQTNREISRRLFITVSTVEQHLTRVYRKLGVARRLDLPPWLEEEIAG